MNKILAIMARNMKIILRSKSSAVIIFLGPLFILLAIGLAFNSSGSDRINIGYVIFEKSELSESFIELMKGNENYALSEISSFDYCKDAIGIGKVHICVIFPEEFRIENNLENKVKFLIDNSKVNLFQSIVDSLEKEFNEKALEFSYGMTSELLKKLNNTTGELKNKTQVLILLKELNKNTSQSLLEAEKIIRDIDTGSPSLDLTTLSIDDAVQDIKKTAEDSLEEANQLIDDIGDAVSDLRLAGKINSTEEVIFELILNETDTSLKALRNQLYYDLEASEKDFDEQLDTVKKSVNQMQTRLRYASEKKQQAKDKLIGMSESMVLQAYQITEIEESFSIITANIDETEITNLDSILTPIKHETQSVVSEDSQLNFYFPYLLILIICFVGTLLGSSITIMEKVSRAYFRNFVTPTKDTIFILGTYFTTMFIITLQVIFLLLVYSLYFGKDILTNLPTTILSLFIISSLFTFIGMLIGNLFQSEETSMLTSISAGCVMIFISDLIYPLERMPEQIAYAAQYYNPFYVSSDLLRKVMIHKIMYFQLYEEFLTVIILFIIFIITVIATFKFAKRHFLMRFSGYIARRDVRKMIQQADQEEIFNLLLDIPSDKSFRAGNKKIRSLEELYDFIHGLSKKEFREYINREDNLFAEWFSRVIGHESFALKLYRTHKRLTTLKLLKAEITNLQRYRKKINYIQNSGE
jgi:ABC-type multidrug transport system permease subunit